jgi:predicted esterase
MKHENGFDFLEFPCASGKPDALIIFLHGYSNHPEMFTDIPARIQKEWPNADVLIVRGPEPIHASAERKANLGVPDVDDLYTWYKVEDSAQKNLEVALKHFFNQVPVVDKLNRFADAQLAKRKLSGDHLVLYGFSLGGAIGMQMATRRKDKCAAVVCHSAPIFPVVSPQSKPRTMLLMGDQDHFFYTRAELVQPAKPAKISKAKGRLKKAFDQVIGSISVHYESSLKRLKRAGLPVTGVLVKGLGHTINEESFTATMDFISKGLKPDKPAP